MVEVYSASEVWNEYSEKQRKVSLMNDEERQRFLLAEAVDEFIKRRAVLKEEPNNSWRVYSICKNINEIAELKGEDFNNASLPDKLIAVTKLLKFVSPEVIFEGVKEYHESGWCQ